MQLEVAVITIISAVFASTGFWELLLYIIKEKHGKQSAGDNMLRGLAHDRICEKGERYIRRGYITKEEYEDLNDYLYVPYTKLQGNGTASKIMKEVEKLPLKDAPIGAAPQKNKNRD